MKPKNEVLPAPTVQQILQAGVQKIGSRFECEEILALVLQTAKSKLYSEERRELKPREQRVIEQMLDERLHGRPLAYVLGTQGFYHETFFVDPRVLIPRPESEILVETAEIFLRGASRDQIRILDLGAGSGCLGLSLAKRFPSAQVDLVERCTDASAVCLQNIYHLGLEDRAQLFSLSTEEFFRFHSKTYDVILANPPYIGWHDPRVEDSVLRFEPHLALFTEEDGFHLVREWSRLARPSLSTEGIMIFEMGVDHSSSAEAHYESLQFRQIKIVNDLTNRPRFIVGFHHG